MSKRCPVCGKFANDDCVRRYEERQLELERQFAEVERLDVELEKSRQEVRRLEKELESKNVQLSYWYGRLTELEERGFWARVFNRKKR